MTEFDPRTQAKRAAGEAAVDRYVKSGQRVGLGTGSTAIWAIRRIGELLAAGTLTDVRGIPTSRAAAQEAEACGIPLITFGATRRLDVTIDGADEVSPSHDLIKGGGGAHLREKVVAQASDQLIIVVDEAKLVPSLGSTFRLPVEVIPFACPLELAYLESLGAATTRRKDFVTDEGNWILDADFGAIDDPAVLLAKLLNRAGIVEVGLFLGMTTAVLVAGLDGVRELRKA